MTIILARVARTRWISQYVLRPPSSAIQRSPRAQMNALSCSCARSKLDTGNKNNNSDPRVSDLGRAIEDDFATIRQTYGTVPMTFPTEELY